MKTNTGSPEHPQGSDESARKSGVGNTAPPGAKIADVHARIAHYCVEIEDLFKPGAKVSVIVRSPLYGVGHTAAVLVSNDDPAAVIGALQYLKTRDEVPHPLSSRLPTPDSTEPSVVEPGNSGLQEQRGTS